jgi:hypothetical protein
MTKEPHSLILSERPTADNSFIQWDSRVLGATTSHWLIKPEWNNPAK